MNNLRKVITAMNSAGSLALILSSSAMAAPPVAFDSWSVGNTAAGVITAACPATFTCSAVADGAGFLQQEMTSSLGVRYVRTMIAEGFVGAAPVALGNLTFASEDFIQLSSTTPGLASKMSIKEGSVSTISATLPIVPGSVGSGFSSTAQILSGWGTNSTANKSEAILTLGLSDAGAGAAGFAGGDEFLTSFNVTANTTTTGLNVTAVLGIDQAVFVGGPDTPANPNASLERQRFKTLVELAAAPSPTGGFKFGTAYTTNPATLTWVAGVTPTKIQVVWVAQDIDGAGGFTSQSLINVDTGAVVRGSNLSAAGTFEWTVAPATVLNSEFGLAPVF